MKYAAAVTLALLAGTSIAEAKGGKQVFNYPHPYDDPREQRPGYKKDYCEDAVGNHLTCQSGSQGGIRNGRYLSRFQAN